MEPGIFSSINDDATTFEKTSLATIAKEGELKAYKHNGFWQCMDKLSDKALLEELWDSGKAPWKTWNDRNI
jgi:glucose-1-phosphate cytidylyltransferase